MESRATKEYEDKSVDLNEKTGVACDRLRKELKRCIKESNCVQIDRRSAKNCLDAEDGRVPDRCYSLLNTFCDCKRSIIDQRARFRGRKGDI